VSTNDRAWWRISQEARDGVTDWLQAQRVADRLEAQGVDSPCVFRVDRISDSEIIVYTHDLSQLGEPTRALGGHRRHHMTVSSPPPPPLGSP
jgi:hypothetical protein